MFGRFQSVAKMLPELPKFETLHTLIDNYQQLREACFNDWEHLLLREARQRISDIELLAERIYQRCSKVLSEEIARGSNLIFELRNTVDPDSDLGRWLSKNSQTQEVGLTKGMTIDGSVGQEPFQTKELQELRLDTELFYYLAHRLFTCLQHLPGLNSLTCREVAVIRNPLIEHPEKKASGILLPSFSFTSEKGPVIKGLRYEHQSGMYEDLGFIHNCRAMIDSIVLALKKAVNKK